MLYFLVFPALLLAGNAVANTSIFRTRDLLVTDSVRCACSQLSSTGWNSTLFPNSTAYETERVNVWDKRSNLDPACIYMPSNANDVAKAVEIFYTCNAPFAVKGGGHMTYPGANTINDGVLLALNNLNGLKVNENDNNIEVGPGNRWVDVYAALAPYGQYAIGGRLKTIGVPGLSLIGGVSYFLNKYGYTMDNVLHYDVVLGNGTQVVANATLNPDLFWALKGGAANYGIVTRFNASAISAFVKASCDMILSENSGSVAAGAVININYNITTKEPVAQVFGMQETTESPPSMFANFTAIPALSRVHNVTAPVHFHSQFDTPNQMFRVHYGHHTIKPDADRLYEIYQAWINAIQDVADVEGIRPTLILNNSPGSAMTVSKTNGIGNTFGLDDEQSYVWWQITTSWARAEDDLRVTTWAQSLLARQHEINMSKGLATDFIYMGDAGEWQKPFPAYGKENFDRMRRIRDEYDPNLVFTKLNWGGFKLGY